MQYGNNKENITEISELQYRKEINNNNNKKTMKPKVDSLKKKKSRKLTNLCSTRLTKVKKKTQMVKIRNERRDITNGLIEIKKN